MALWNFGSGVSIVESGNCRGARAKSEGMLRPRGPSGDDCNESVAGLAVDEVPLGVAAEAEVTVHGIDVLTCCLPVGCADGVGDGQHLLPSVMLGDEVSAVRGILYHLERVLTGSLLVGGSRVIVSFRIVSEGGVAEGLIAR